MRFLLYRLLRRLHAQPGMVGLEAGVVIGGLALASALVGGAVLAGGLNASSRLDAAVQSALDRTGSGVMLDGPVIVRTDGTHATSVLLDVSTLPGSRPVRLTAGADAGALRIDYVSASLMAGPLPFEVSSADGGTLSDGETAHITVDLSSIDGPASPGASFTLIVRPGDLPPLRVERTLPAGKPMDAVLLLD